MKKGIDFGDTPAERDTQVLCERKDTTAIMERKETKTTARVTTLTMWRTRCCIGEQWSVLGEPPS